MARRRFYYRTDSTGQAIRVTQLMEVVPGRGLRNAPHLVGHSRTFRSVADLEHALRLSTGGEVTLTRLMDDDELPSSPSSPV